MAAVLSMRSHDHGNGQEKLGHDFSSERCGDEQSHGHSASSNSHLELGQQSLLSGDVDAAVQHLQAELVHNGGTSVDAPLLLAEALWQRGGSHGSEEALTHYEAAAKLAQEAGDSMKEGMIALGHGFALSKLGRAVEARSRLEYARDLAENDGNTEAAQFVQNMISQVADASEAIVDDSEVTRKTWRQFAEAMAAGKPAQLFLRGSIAAPADDASWRGVSRLRAAGCRHIEYLNVEQPGDFVPEGLQAISRSPHLEFPQLFVEGKELSDWIDMPLEQLRQRLQQAGLSLGEMQGAEPCHGTAAFSDGLEPWEVALVEMVAKDGAADWDAKARALDRHLQDLLKATPRQIAADGADVEAATVEAAWRRLAPRVKDRLENQPEMPCGHSCDTCPTRHDCHLHDALEGKSVKDIEDLF
jgi:glutaredoxin-related protein